MKDALNNISAALNDTMGEISRAFDKVSTGADQVSSGAQALSQGATEQASSVEELAATINKISSQIDSTAGNAREASQKASRVGHEVAESNRRMEDMLAAISYFEQLLRSIECIRHPRSLATQPPTYQVELACQTLQRLGCVRNSSLTAAL